MCLKDLNKKSLNMKIIISFFVVSLALIHVFFPDLGIDGITIILIIIAVLPWSESFLKLFSSLVKSIELPGGTKIEFKDLKNAMEKIKAGKEDITIPKPATANISAKIGNIIEGKKETIRDPISIISEIAKADTNLSLVAFRIEIEKRIRKIAEISGITAHNIPLATIIQQMKKQNIINQKLSSGLLELVALGNKAAHGKEVSKEAAQWVLDIGFPILRFLDEKIKESLNTN